MGGNNEMMQSYFILGGIVIILPLVKVLIVPTPMGRD